MLYKCNRCTKEFNRRLNYETHLSRKYPCKPLLQLDIINKEVLVGKDINNTEELVEKIHRCPHCNIVVSRSDILYRHINKNCKVKKQNDATAQEREKILLEIIEEMRNDMQHEIAQIKVHATKLEEENIEMKKTLAKKTKNAPAPNNINIAPDNMEVNINSNNNNTTNVITNIIVPFGKEQYGDVISDAQCDYFLGRGLSSITEVIKYVHFNKKFPQFHNCYISNARDNHAIIFDGTNWVLIDMTDGIKELIEKSGGFLICKYEELKPLLTDKAKKQFKRYLNQQDTPDLAKRYKKEIKLSLYNYGDMVMATRKTQVIEDKKEGGVIIA